MSFLITPPQNATRNVWQIVVTLFMGTLLLVYPAYYFSQNESDTNYNVTPLHVLVVTQQSELEQNMWNQMKKIGSGIITLYGGFQIIYEISQIVRNNLVLDENNSHVSEPNDNYNESDPSSRSTEQSEKDNEEKNMNEVEKFNPDTRTGNISEIEGVSYELSEKSGQYYLKSSDGKILTVERDSSGEMFVISPRGMLIFMEIYVCSIKCVQV